MPQESKGRTVKRTLRTTPETSARLAALAADRGGSVDDLIEHLATEGGGPPRQPLQITVELRAADLRREVEAGLRVLLGDLAATMREHPGESWADAVRQIEAFRDSVAGRA